MEDGREDADGGPRVSDPESGELSGESGDEVVRVEWADVERPTIDVVEAVARTIGSDPIALPPLNDTVDGDAVAALLRAADEADLRLSFRYAGTSVVVRGGESIEVRPTSA